MDNQYYFERLKELKSNLGRVIRGKEKALELMVSAVIANGSVLLEDVPGVGKTTLAKGLAASLDCRFSRIQFTPDLLPADIIGSSVYNPKDGSFRFRSGPVFTNILLADEINRASPRTQSALLEAMSERQVSVEGRTTLLERPFLVIATENPIEYQGTYQLPEAQLDRFAIQLSLGYPDCEFELEMLFDRLNGDPAETLAPVLGNEDVVEIQNRVRLVRVEDSVAAYMLELVRGTRSDKRIALGASPRALLLLSRCAQATAYQHGREFVLPDDVKKVAVAVLAHRLTLDNKSRYSGITSQQVIEDLLAQTRVPN